MEEVDRFGDTELRADPGSNLEYGGDSIVDIVQRLSNERIENVSLSIRRTQGSQPSGDAFDGGQNVLCTARWG